MIQDWKLFRKDTAFVTRSLVWYTAINMIVATIVMAIAEQFVGSNTGTLLESVQGEISAIGMLAGVIIGVICLLVMGRKSRPPIQIFQKTEKKMTIGKFVQYGVFLLMGQFIFSMLVVFFESILNVFGLSMEVLTRLATADVSSGIMMTLYVGLVGPVVEELIYRGFLLRHFQRYGKVFALLMTSILFGVMHANPLQIVFGSLVGLVFGYVALEYSIKWSIALHVANNFLLGYVLPWIGKLLLGDNGNVLITGIIVIGFIAGIILLVLKRETLIRWFRENKVSGELYWNALTTPSAILFIGYNLWTGFSLVLMVLFPNFFQ